MLRRGKFSKTEGWLVWLIGLILFAAGGTGVGLGISRGEWKIGFAGIGMIALAVIYLIAAIRRRPL
jgi:hypothetical protein